MRDRILGVSVAAVCIGMIGCADTEAIGTDEQAIINGTPTDERPEVGLITNSGCTATLVASKVILTAAHCVGFQTGPTSDGFLTGHGEFFAIDYVSSKTNSAPGWDDLAVARLTSRVPSSSAVPTRAAYAGAGANETVTVYGYGCIDRANPSVGYGTKRKYSYPYYMRYQIDLLCPGDSGGPMIHPYNGVIEVNSGYYLDGGDIFASVNDNYSWVSAWVNYLNQ